MMVFRLIIWKYLGLKMDSYDERELLNITEYLSLHLLCTLSLYKVIYHSRQDLHSRSVKDYPTR